MSVWLTYLTVGDFVLRIFASKPIQVEPVLPIPVSIHSGEWKRIGDLDTTGGPPTIQQPDGTYKDNPKWCQNPQYHIQIADPYGKDEIYLKIVLRKVDNKHTKSNQKTVSSSEEKKANASLGLVICKAEVLEDAASKIKNKAPRQNKLGEVSYCGTYFEEEFVISLLYVSPFFQKLPHSKGRYTQRM